MPSSYCENHEYEYCPSYYGGMAMEFNYNAHSDLLTRIKDHFTLKLRKPIIYINEKRLKKCKTPEAFALNEFTACMKTIKKQNEKEKCKGVYNFALKSAKLYQVGEKYENLVSELKKTTDEYEKKNFIIRLFSEHPNKTFKQRFEQLEKKANELEFLNVSAETLYREEDNSKKDS